MNNIKDLNCSNVSEELENALDNLEFDFEALREAKAYNATLHDQEC